MEGTACGLCIRNQVRHQRTYPVLILGYETGRLLGFPGLIALSDDSACNASDFYTRADLPARDMLASHCPLADNQPRRYTCERRAGTVLLKCEGYAGITLPPC